MKIQIIFDNKTDKQQIKTGWGFSCIINDNILFDTSDSPFSLFYNLEVLGIKVSDINKVIISHDHWDHTGGLWEMIDQNPDIKLYTCPQFSQKFKNKVSFNNAELIEISDFTKIEKNIYSTGEIEGFYKSEQITEQGVVINTSKGLILITGCAHPGIIKVVEHVKANIKGDFHLIMGGFHLYNKAEEEIISVIDFLRKTDVSFVGPCHCTGITAINLFQKEFKDKYIEIKVGETIEV